MRASSKPAHRLRLGIVLVVVVLAAAGCSGTADDDARATLPAERPQTLVDGEPHRGVDGLPGQLVEALTADIDSASIVGARTLEALPAEAESCPADTGWDGTVEASRVIVGPISYSAALSGTIDGAEHTFMCEWNADWTLVTADDVTQTGTTQPVGSRYLSAVAGVVGVADGGWPEDAVVAVQPVGEWTYVVAPGGVPPAVRFTASSDGTLGEVRFYDWFGENVTPEESPIPEVIHGVPRSTGSGVE